MDGFQLTPFVVVNFILIWNKFISSSTDFPSTELSSTLSTPSTLLTSKTTTQQCIFESNPSYFQCTTTGRFPNLNDATCQTYFLCNLLRNGTYIKTQYSCPQTSYFNPPLQVCDVTYECPCTDTETTTGTESTITTESTTVAYPSTTTTTTSEPNSTESTTTIEPTYSTSMTVTTPETTTQQCIFESDPSYFQCTTTGRFPNLNDATCQTYFLCNLLRNGTYIKTQYGCPQTSYFNPPLQVCDVTYECPCINTETTTTTSTESPITTESTTVIYPSTTTFSTSSESTYSTPTTVTTITPETTTQQCIFESDPSYFQCTTTGRFPNLNDATCQTYFLCNLLRNGTYIKTQYSCPQTSYFNPPLQVCDVTYECPCIETDTTTTTSTESTITTESTTVAYPSTTTTSEPNPTESATTTEPTYSTSTTVTTLAPETTTQQCIFESDPSYFQCTTTGRFPNLNDATCQTYFLCNLLRNGTYVKTQYSCPQTSYFNPPLQVCDVTYECPCINTETTTTTSTESPITTESTTVTYPSNTTFSTSSDSTYSTPTTVTTLTPETTTQQCIFESDPSYFQCTTTGRFPNLNDATCQTYFLCNLLRNGTYIKTQYSCPQTSYFNPPLQVCDVTYECPCIETETTTITSTESTIATESTTVAYPSTTTTTTSEPTTTIEPTYSTSTTVTTLTPETTTQQCIFESDPSYFQCTTTGRFPNLNDATCQTYFLCNLLRNGTYIKTQYSCPQTSYFKPPLQVCDVTYECPCIDTETTTTTSTESTITTESTTVAYPSTTTVSTTSEPNSTESNSMTEPTDSTPTTVTTPTPETTTQQCIFETDPSYFQCTTTGRFPNLNDATCQTYFLCNLLRNGTYVKTQYSCPATSYFNPPLQVCDVTYECPCIDTETTTSTESTITTESTTVTYPSTTISSTTSEPNSTESTATTEPTYSTTTTVTTLTPETTTQQCIFESDPSYFQCTTTGRFPNLNDATCQTYFLCNLLRNGTYIKTQYSCPATSYFNPPLQVCDVTYECPCIDTETTTSTSTESTITTESTTVTYPSTTISSTTSEPNSTESTATTEPTYSTTTTVTTLTPETTTQQCIFESDPSYFQCTTTGRFPNLNDATCQTYFLCNLLRNGTYIKTPYSCPETSYFNPPLQVCDVTYECPCIDTETTTSTSTESTITTESTTVAYPFTTTVSTTSEPNSTESNSMTEPTDSTPTTVTTPTPETTTQQCIFETDPSYFQCTTTGRFPNLNDATCQTYFLCNLLRNGTYVKTQYSCPATSYFNPPLQVCDVTYECPCIDTETTTTTSTESTITTESTTITYPSSIISSTTSEPNSTESTATTEPTYSTTTTVTTTSTESPITTESTTVTYPSTTTFSTTSEPNPTESATTTEPTYSTPTTVTTPETTTQECIFESDPSYFQCTTTGRFPNLNDATCQTYFLCNLLRNGTYIKTQYSCPQTSYFNPPLQVCDVTYDCPCIDTETTTTTISESTITTESTTVTCPSTTTVSTTTEPNSTETTTTVEPTYSTATTVTTLTPETTTQQCIFESDPTYFQCTTTGRFPNLNDATCQTYFLCNLLRNGTYIKTQYSCPQTSYFNPPLQVCDVTYECPCIETDTTTTTSTESTITTESTTVTYPSTTTFSTSSESTYSTPTTVTTLTPETTTQQCIFESDPSYFQCTTTGRFPNLNDATCQTYFLCNLLRNGTYIKTQYSCPETSYFNSPLQVCDTSYECPCVEIGTSTS